MTMYGMDLSHYQDPIDLIKGNYDFCIIKATEGIGYTDKSFDKFALQLTRLNKLIGCYHYARPDLHGTIEQMRKEAYWFIEEVRRMNLLGKSILILDWEKEPMDREDLVTAWCEEIIEETGITPFIYGSKSKLKQWRKLGWTILDKYPIWIASWPSNNRMEVGTEVNVAPPLEKWNIWQYSATGAYPGFSGNVDLDLTYMTEDMWRTFALYNIPVKEEVITPPMEWCIDKGIFIGDGEGHYFPKRPLTREEAAQVIYKLYFLFKNKLNSLYGKMTYSDTDSIKEVK